MCSVWESGSLKVVGVGNNQIDRITDLPVLRTWGAGSRAPCSWVMETLIIDVLVDPC